MNINKAFVFIIYHPGVIIYYDFIRKALGNRYTTILIGIRHPYVTDLMIDEFYQKFDHKIFLPDLQYSISSSIA